MDSIQDHLVRYLKRKKKQKKQLIIEKLFTCKTVRKQKFKVTMPKHYKNINNYKMEIHEEIKHDLHDK